MNFQELLYHCGLSQKGAARILGVSYDTVKSWSCGRNGIPKAVMRDLNLLKKSIDKIFYSED